MKSLPPRLVAAAMLFLAAAVFAGCRTTPPVMFYTLSPLAQAGERALGDAGPLVGLGPVTIPQLLDRPQIVTRTSANRIDMSEFHRWGGSLKDALPRVLAHDLAVHLGSGRVALYPWKLQVKPDYRVGVDVLQFDGQLGEEVALSAAWEISRPGDNGVLAVRRTTCRIPVAGGGYEAFVAAQSRAVDELAKTIAEAIAVLEKRG